MSDLEDKVIIAKQKKEIGDVAFKNGQVKDALRSYHEALMYLLGIEKNAMKAMAPESGGDPTKPKEEKTEVDELLEKIYANMAACHIKTGNWKRALETADKALAKNEHNHKALLRKGKALGELGYFEKAEKILQDLANKNPADAAGINQELARLRAIDREREAKNKEKMKGFLLKGAKRAIGKTDGEPSAEVAAESPVASTSAVA